MPCYAGSSVRCRRQEMPWAARSLILCFFHVVSEFQEAFLEVKKREVKSDNPYLLWLGSNGASCKVGAQLRKPWLSTPEVIRPMFRTAARTSGCPVRLYRCFLKSWRCCIWEPKSCRSIRPGVVFREGASFAHSTGPLKNRQKARSPRPSELHKPQCLRLS